MRAGGAERRSGCAEARRRFPGRGSASSGVLVPPGGRRYTVTKMYHFCLLEPALFRFLHDAPRSELLIDLL